MHTRRIAIVLSLLIVGLFAAVASGHTTSYFTEPHITNSSGHDGYGMYKWIGGTVESNKAACRTDRKVQLRDGSGALVASTTSKGKGHGRWRIYSSVSYQVTSDNTYFVTVPKKVLGTGKHRRICQAGKSKKTAY
jgi:hypothetical protein